MFYACAVRFDMSRNLKKFVKFWGTKQPLYIQAVQDSSRDKIKEGPGVLFSELIQNRYFTTNHYYQNIGVLLVLLIVIKHY